MSREGGGGGCGIKEGRIESVCGRGTGAVTAAAHFGFQNVEMFPAQ